MYTNPSQRAYAQGQGTVATNGAIVTDRDPTANDTTYPIGQFWINNSAIKLWYLNFLSNQSSPSNPSGALQATWELISVSSVLASLSDTGNANIVFPSDPFATPPDNIQIAGDGVTISVTGDPTNHKLVISSIGAGAETLTGDDGVAVSPSAGTIQTLGNTVANSTHAKPLFTHNPSTNIEEWDIQVSAAIASTDVNKTGLSAFSNTQFAVDANGFVTLVGGTGPVTLGLTPDSITGTGTTPVVPNGSGDIIVTNGSKYSTGTNANAIRTQSTAVNTLAIELQLAGSNASTSTANNFGVAQFDSNQFSVTSGFVKLAGGSGPGIQTLTGNTGGALSPTAGNINTLGTGSITIAGAGSTLTTQLTGLTSHDVLIGQGTATIGLVAPSATSGVPLISQGAAADPVFGTAVVAGGGTGDTSFTAFSVITGGTTSTGPLQNVSGVGTSGQLLTSNGAGVLPTWQTIPGTTQFTLDAATTPITPSAGNITLTGGQVATGTVGANVIRTRGNTSSSATIEIQRTTTSGVSNSNLNGVCHFNSTNFTVDTNGYVSFVSGSTSFPWTDEGGNFNASSNNGYFCTALLSATLPPTPANGDIVRIVVDTTSAVTVVANTGQKIRIANTISALAGNAVNTLQGDSLELVYRSSSATWYTFSGANGTWVVT